MSSRELSEWVAYDELYRIPDPYWIGGMIAWAIATFFGTGKKKWKIEDFIPREQPKEAVTPEQMKSRFRGLAEDIEDQKRAILERRESL